MMDIKKEAFYKAYAKYYGNVSKACKAVDLSRSHFYYLKNTDKEFREGLENIKPDELLVDLLEDALVKKVKKGDTTAIIFGLKTKGRHRGYSEYDNAKNNQVEYKPPTIVNGSELPEEGKDD